MGVVLLVRHGQASFGGPDYDVLSERGEEQARVLGDRLRGLGGVDRILHGAMLRQAHTAELVATRLHDPPAPQEDARWDEYDHEALLTAALRTEAQRRGFEQALAEADDERRAFQQQFEAALARWTGGGHDVEYDEPFGDFRSRVGAALDELVDGLDRSQTALVVTSGGVISAVCATYLGLDAAGWARLNRVLVNTSVTKLVVGRGGVNLVTVNDHAHLETAGPDAITYR